MTIFARDKNDRTFSVGKTHYQFIFTLVLQKNT